MLTPDPWIVIALAPFIGSFLGVVIVRMPAGDGFVTGRSRCPACGHPLGVRDLVPVVSWLACRGRCRYCGAGLSRFYPLIEMAAMLVAVWAASVVTAPVLLPTCVLGWTLLTLAVIDQRHLILPDAVTLPLMVGGLVIAALLPEADWRDHLVGAGAGFAVFAAVAAGYRRLRGREGLGGGDAKLLAAGGAWVSWTGLASVVFLAAVLGLAAALVDRWRRPGQPAEQAIPFGPYLCAAIWCTWLYGPLEMGW